MHSTVEQECVTSNQLGKALYSYMGYHPNGCDMNSPFSSRESRAEMIALKGKVTE